MGNLETPETGGLAGMGVKLKAILGEQDPAAPTPATLEGQAADKAAAEPPVQKVVPVAPKQETPLVSVPLPEEPPVEPPVEVAASASVEQVELPEWLRSPEPPAPPTPTLEPEAPAAVKAETTTAGPVTGGAKRMEGAQLEPVPLTFADRVGMARGLVAGAVKEAGALPKEVSEQQKRVAETTSEFKTPVAQAEGIESSKKTRAGELSAEEVENLEVTRDIMKRSGFPTDDLDEMIAIQRQYRLGQEMAAEVNKKYGAELKLAADELKPGWFKTEPVVVREMAELQAFFDRTGNAEELRRTIAEIEEEKRGRAWRNGGITDRYKKQTEAELARANADLATLESAEGFLARQDMPRVLGEAIAARRAGREYPFGTGPVANFRRKVYESVVSTLGIEAAPAVEVLEAAAPAVALAPEPESEPAAPVETAEQIRQRVEEEFWGEDKLDPEVERVQAKLRGNVARGIANPKAVAEALAIQAEQSSEARRAVAAGAKQLAVSVLAEARSEKDSKKRQKMLTWVKDFGVGFEATSMAGSISLNVLDALISAIVNELGGQK